MTPEYLLALDQGTTSSRCIIFSRGGEIVSSAQKEFTQYYPHKGWVEHDACEILETQLFVARDAMARLVAKPSDIGAIGIANQRETVVVWDKNSGKPICPAIVWQCRRTAGLCDKLREQGYTETIRQKTGLVIDAYFSATKIQWILENIEGAKERAQRGELLFGTIDCWLVWNLTGVHATDPSNAARTMLYNIHTLDWDDELLELFGIPRAMMPEIMPSSGVFGYTDRFGGKIPVAGVAGDQQAALFGQCCFEAGDVKNTYGTGGFMLMNTGSTPVSSKNGLLTTVAWQIGGKTEYALEGSTFACGAAIQWLRDGLGLIESAAQSEYLAGQVSNNGGVYLVPAFVGLGAPWWDAYARGAIFGITRGTTKNHIIRAALESMAYQTYDLLKTMETDANVKLSSLKVDGGASANDLLLKFQSDIAGLPIIRPACIETTALGAANLAGLAVGYYSSKEEISEGWKKEHRFEPDMPQKDRDALLNGWHCAVKRSLGWIDSEK